jgi:arylsulfatase A-like enzyme
LLACERQPQHPNLILISLDTTRADHLSAYGYPRDTTPNLRRFAAEGVRFDAAYSATSSTGPSHASLFTSLYPSAHGVLKNGVSLAEAHESLAERLEFRGYQTGAVVSSFVLSKKFGWGQGFAFFDDRFDRKEATVQRDSWEGHSVDAGFDRRAQYTTDRALRWLRWERDPQRPFFLFVHYFDPHQPYDPPEPVRSRLERALTGQVRDAELLIALYDGELEYMDQEVGALLAGLSALELDAKTLVGITGDHGEGLLQHGYVDHGVFLYEEFVRVPLLLRWPGHLPSGRVIREPVESVDVAPTLLSLLGFPAAEAAFQGKDLASALTGEAELDPERPIYLQRQQYRPGMAGSMVRIWVSGELFGIRAGRWKYLEGDAEEARELFDLRTDPRETRNLITEHPEQAARLSRTLGSWRGQFGASAMPGADRLDPEDREALEALGYIE